MAWQVVVLLSGSAGPAHQLAKEAKPGGTC